MATACCARSTAPLSSCSASTSRPSRGLTTATRTASANAARSSSSACTWAAARALRPEAPSVRCRPIAAGTLRPDAIRLFRGVKVARGGIEPSPTARERHSTRGSSSTNASSRPGRTTPPPQTWTRAMRSAARACRVHGSRRPRRYSPDTKNGPPIAWPSVNARRRRAACSRFCARSGTRSRPPTRSSCSLSSSHGRAPAPRPPSPTTSSACGRHWRESRRRPQRSPGRRSRRPRRSTDSSSISTNWRTSISRRLQLRHSRVPDARARGVSPWPPRAPSGRA